MKRKILNLLLLIFSLQPVIWSQANSETKALEILENFIDVTGGRTKLEKVEDETINFVSPPGTPMIKLTIIRKYPNKYFQLLVMEGFSQQVVFDGEKGKTVQFGQEMFFDEAENNRMREQNMTHLLLDTKILGIKAEYTGDETINGVQCNVVKMDLHHDVEWTLYFDKDTHYMIRQIIPIFTDSGKYDQTVDFYDYRDFDGYVYASRLKQIMGPQTVELLIDSVKVNSGVDDSIFELN